MNCSRADCQHKTHHCCQECGEPVCYEHRKIICFVSAFVDPDPGAGPISVMNPNPEIVCDRCLEKLEERGQAFYEVLDIWRCLERLSFPHLKQSTKKIFRLVQKFCTASYSMNPPFHRVDDRQMFTKVLIAAGYRLFLLERKPKTWRVWAKAASADGMPDLSVFADGMVMPVELDGVEVLGDDVIILDEADGGSIVYGYGRTIS